jgi:hypothetical protein
VVASLENGVVRKVPRHFPLVPSLAYDHKAVRGSAIMEEDEVFMRLSHGLPQTRVALSS